MGIIARCRVSLRELRERPCFAMLTPRVIACSVSLNFIFTELTSCRRLRRVFALDQGRFKATRMFRVLIRWLKQIITALIVLVLVVCGFEIGLRVYDSHCGQITRCELFDSGAITKSRSCHHELKPLLKLEVNPSSGQPPFQFETNSLGVRGGEIDVPKPRGTYRIVCLGDERTLAMDLPQEQTFCVRLQELLQSVCSSRIEVINAGVPDYCPLLSTLQFRQKLSGLAPDLVVLNWDMSDVWDDYRYRRYTTMGDQDTPLGCSHPLLDPPRERERRRAMDLFLLPKFTIQQMGQIWAGRVLPMPPREIDSPTGKYTWLQDQPPDWSVYINQSLSAMLPARDLCERLGGTFVLAVHPAPWQVAATASNGEGVRAFVGVPDGVRYESRGPFDTILDFCEQEEVWCLDLSDAIQADRLAVDLYQRNSANYTSSGHTVSARSMASFLVKNLDGPWRSAQPRGARQGLAVRRGSRRD